MFFFRQDLPLLRPTFLQNHQLIQHFHSNSSFKLYPGDDIILNCHHNSSSFKYPIFGGISASEEICLVLLTHYCPKNEDESCPLSKIKSCISWPTDETLAKVFNFELDFYEQYNRFSNKRFVYLLFELIKKNTAIPCIILIIIMEMRGHNMQGVTVIKKKK